MRLPQCKTANALCRRISLFAPCSPRRPCCKESRPKLFKELPVRHRSDQASESLESHLAKPTWSVRSLLPPAEGARQPSEVTSEQLHHLLRLSALPLPKNSEEEAKMLKTLVSQLHFVKEMQKVDTTGVVPLRSLRDETAAAEAENEISLETLKNALGEEEVVGQHHRRIRRKQAQAGGPNEAENWDVMGNAERKLGNYFVVDTAKS